MGRACSRRSIVLVNPVEKKTYRVYSIISQARSALTMFTHNSWAESCDGRGAGIDFTDRQRVWASAKSAQCQPAAPGKVDRSDEAALAANERRTLMGRLTKQQERALFIAEFVRRLRAAAPGERVYMRVGDVFKDADVIELREWQAARRKQTRRKKGGGTDPGK
jgi:hypothetical protein